MMKVYGYGPNHYAVITELEEIEAKLKAEANKGGVLSDWYHIFSAPRMGYRIALRVLLQMFQQLNGANYFFYYSTIVFQATGIRNRVVTQMIVNGFNMGVTPIEIYLVEAAGRRTSLILGS
jgi:SP family sugar:H+ symporter-like MFS transporter